MLYSAKKKKANKNPEYSVKKPATNSDSDSGKSKGTRPVSANIENQKITKRSICITKKRPDKDWLIKKDSKDNPRFKKTKISKINDIINSYPSTWFAPRVPPIAEYFEKEAQPAAKKDKEEADKIKNMNNKFLLPKKLIDVRLKIVPYSIAINTGNNVQLKIEIDRIKISANWNKIKLEWFINMICLPNNLPPSTNGWNNPLKPIIFGLNGVE